MVLDAVGKSSLQSVSTLADAGRNLWLNRVRPLAQNPALTLVTPRFSSKKRKFPIPQHDQEVVQHFKELMESEQFTPVIDRCYPLDEFVEAYGYVETGRKIEERRDQRRPRAQ